jgi:hypothetical protein
VEGGDEKRSKGDVERKETLDSACHVERGEAPVDLRMVARSGLKRREAHGMAT